MNRLPFVQDDRVGCWYFNSSSVAGFKPAGGLLIVVSFEELRTASRPGLNAVMGIALSCLKNILSIKSDRLQKNH